MGGALAAHYRFKNQNVTAITRTEKKKTALEQAGIKVLVADLNRPETLENLPHAHFAVIAVAPEKRDPESYRKTYVEGVGNLLSRIEKNRWPLFILYLSSTGVYGDKQGQWVDETTPPEPDTETGRILLEAEQQFLRSKLPGAVLRLSGIYGPGRNWADGFRKGEWGLKDKDGYMNMIHVEDIVSAMTAVFKRSQSKTIYLVTDDEPVKRSEFALWLGEKLGLEDTRQKIKERMDCSVLTGKRCSNAQLKSLRVKLKYPTFREGYEALLAAASLKPA